MEQDYNLEQAKENFSVQDSQTKSSPNCWSSLISRLLDRVLGLLRLLLGLLLLFKSLVTVLVRVYCMTI